MAMCLDNKLQIFLAFFFLVGCFIGPAPAKSENEDDSVVVEGNEYNLETPESSQNLKIQTFHSLFVIPLN